MPQVSENAKSIAENFVEEHHLKRSEINSLARWIDKLLNKIGQKNTEEVALEVSTACNEGRIQNPAATLIAQIKTELENEPKKTAKPEDEPPKKKYSTCPNCGNLEASKQTCTQCGWLAPNLIPHVNTTYGTNPKLPPRDTIPITVNDDLSPANLKNLLCQVFEIPQNSDEANSILTEINYLRTKTNQQTTVKTVRKLVKDHAIGLVHHPVIYTNIAVKNATENSENQ